MGTPSFCNCGWHVAGIHFPNLKKDFHNYVATMFFLHLGCRLQTCLPTFHETCFHNILLQNSFPNSCELLIACAMLLVFWSAIKHITSLWHSKILSSTHIYFAVPFLVICLNEPTTNSTFFCWSMFPTMSI